MKNLILLYLLFFVITISAQGLKFINAPSGLVIRKYPNKTSSRIGKLGYGDVVKVIKETGVKLSIVDNGKTINGQWVEIEHINGNQKGYIFNGYLVSNVMNKGMETEHYYITKFHPNRYKDFSYGLENNIKVNSPKIKLRNKEHLKLYEISIGELEMYENITLYEKKITGLENITRIISIECTHSACCSSTEEYNFLVDNSNNLIELPQIGNSHCDGPEPYNTYLYPNDIGGKKEKILFVKVNPTKDSIPENIEILKSFHWNGINLSKK